MLKITARSTDCDGKPVHYELSRAPCGKVVWLYIGRFLNRPHDIFIPDLPKRRDLAPRQDENMREFLEGDL